MTLLPPDFASTGFHVARGAPAGTPLTRYQVLGERSSGTNFVSRLLGRNSDLRPVDVLGWKHGFVQALAVPGDLAVICVVRAPEPWALSMFAKPWHTPPAMQALEFGAFIRAPWATIIDRPRYFDGIGAPALGQPLQQDRDPVTGAVFDSLFALRRAKLASLLSYLNRDCTCIFLRAEAVQAAPEDTLAALRGALGQPPLAVPFRPVVKRLGSKFKPAVATRPDGPARMSPQDRDFMWQMLDRTQEAQLGYIPDQDT